MPKFYFVQKTYSFTRFPIYQKNIHEKQLDVLSVANKQGYHLHHYAWKEVLFNSGFSLNLAMK